MQDHAGEFSEWKRNPLVALWLIAICTYLFQIGWYVYAKDRPLDSIKWEISSQTVTGEARRERMGISLFPFIGFVELNQPDGIELRFRYLGQTQSSRCERLHDVRLSHLEAFQEGGQAGVRLQGSRDHLALFEPHP